MRPALLDLFAGAGGCSAGYSRSGFNVVGVDHEPHPDYPFRMYVHDALSLLADGKWLATFNVIHASPPCQGYTTMSNRHRGAGGKADSHQNLISWVRLGLQASGKPYVIENVPGARKEMRDPISLHGGMFGLGVHRPRLFESNVPLTVTRAPQVKNPVGVYGKRHDGRRLFTRADGSNQYAARTLVQAQEAMGIDWMGWADLTEAVPPSYCEFIGRQLIAHLGSAAA